MPEDDALQIVLGDLHHERRRLGIGKVAVISRDPLLRGPGTFGILLEQLVVVIGLNEDAINPGGYALRDWSPFQYR